MNFSDDRVQFIFDQMAGSYDDVPDLWYSWLFCRLHSFIVKDVICRWDDTPRSVLDVGCGTGFQSFLYANAGADVLGIDISPELIGVAEGKKLNPPTVGSILKPHFGFVDAYNKKLTTDLNDCLEKREYKSPAFSLQSVLDLKLPNDEFDHINCCGSVLSFIQDYQVAFSEISRVLKPGGSFIFEMEAKYNFDLFWTLIDSLTGGWLGYETLPSEAMKPFKTGLSEYVDVEYPFGETDNPVYMPIKLYTRSGLYRDLRQHNLHVTKSRTVHSITNLLPSTVLDSDSPSRLTIKLFSMLSRLEEVIPWNLPGCSIVLLGTKML